jgi:transposase-like protein
LHRPHGAQCHEVFSYKDLKKVYAAASEEAGRQVLEDFGENWNTKYPMIYRSWISRWDDLGEFFKYPPEIRRADIYDQRH